MMTNHVHLMLETPQANLSRALSLRELLRAVLQAPGQIAVPPQAE